MNEKGNWITPLIGGTLCLAGIVGIMRCPSGVGQRLSEALFIAGFLTVAVDPFLRRRLLKEATTDIFHHLLGFDLPVEIRETLKEFLFANRFYRRNVIIDANVQSRPDGTVEVTWTMNADLVAVAATVWNQHVSFEEPEQGAILEASVTSSVHPELNYAERSPALKPDKDQPMVAAWSGRKIRLRKGDEIHSFVKFTTRGPRTGFSTTHFGNPTINPRVRVSGSADLEVFSSAADQQNQNEYIHRKVFVQGDHIQVRWRPKVYARG